MNQISQLLKLLFRIPPFRQLLVFWKALTASWRIYLENPVPVGELTHYREAASIPSFGFFFLLISATVIATLGLLLNSSAVIIGAMIVAPLMNPILSIAFASVTGNWQLYRRSLATVFLGCFCTISVSYLITVLVGLGVVGSEIINRTSPNLLDLGIAISAGAAGSFSLTRKSIASSIAGVAIAVALIPPLCVVGISMGMGSELIADFGHITVTTLNVSSGALLLFLANLVGITFAACIVFLSQSYGNRNQAFHFILVWLVIIAVLCAPLTRSLKEFLIDSRIDTAIQEVRSEHPEIAQKSQIRHIAVRLEGATAYIEIIVLAPQGLVINEYRQTVKKRIFDSLSKMEVQSMDVVLKVIPIEIKEYKLLSK